MVVNAGKKRVEMKGKKIRQLRRLGESGTERLVGCKLKHGKRGVGWTYERLDCLCAQVCFFCFLFLLWFNRE